MSLINFSNSRFKTDISYIYVKGDKMLVYIRTKKIRINRYGFCTNILDLFTL